MVEAPGSPWAGFRGHCWCIRAHWARCFEGSSRVVRLRRPAARSRRMARECAETGQFDGCILRDLAIIWIRHRPSWRDLPEPGRHVASLTGDGLTGSGDEGGSRTCQRYTGGAGRRALGIYAVVLHEADEAAWQSLRQEWPGRHFILTDHLAFVAPEGTTTTTHIAESSGIGDERGLLGVVLEVSAQTGFHRNDLWEWLRMVLP